MNPTTTTEALVTRGQTFQIQPAPGSDIMRVQWFETGQVVVSMITCRNTREFRELLIGLAAVATMIRAVTPAEPTAQPESHQPQPTPNLPTAG